MKVTVKVDSTVCITAANCVGVAPKFFHIGQESYVEVLNRDGAAEGTFYAYEATKEELELLVEAADSCPTQAIEVLEGE
jgi:ferredoxin